MQHFTLAQDFQQCSWNITTVQQECRLTNLLRKKKKMNNKANKELAGRTQARVQKYILLKQTLILRLRHAVIRTSLERLKFHKEWGLEFHESHPPSDNPFLDSRSSTYLVFGECWKTCSLGISGLQHGTWLLILYRSRCKESKPSCFGKVPAWV